MKKRQYPSLFDVKTCPFQIVSQEGNICYKICYNIVLQNYLSSIFHLGEILHTFISDTVFSMFSSIMNRHPALWTVSQARCWDIDKMSLAAEKTHVP